MNDFYSQIYDLVRMIPEGRVTTYGAIAKALGVGKIVKTCWNCYEHSHDVLPNVPAHRVVNRIVLQW
jgi:methylated-DNA-protein-cysteine methyltransferase-like protein